MLASEETARDPIVRAVSDGTRWSDGTPSFREMRNETVDLSAICGTGE